tara:strand:+ start:378 stop:563 length:186 start_codon:yes stop_codon:yes gene_type:complete
MDRIEAEDLPRLLRIQDILEDEIRGDGQMHPDTRMSLRLVEEKIETIEFITAQKERNLGNY